MKQMNVLRILLVCVLSLTFASCGDDIYLFENRDEDLCNKLWVTNYVTDEGYTATYQLRFFTNGKGQEIMVIPVSGGTNTTDKEINWNWVDNSKECIQLIYTDSSVKYLENVWVRDHYLSVQSDGTQWTFVESTYQH